MKSKLQIATAAVLTLIAVEARSAEPIRTTQLTEALYMLSTDQGSYTTNTLAFVGDDGVLLVDTQSEGDAEALKNAVTALGKGLPKYIINTHRHVEHVGGNAVFGEDPIVIAHELVPARLRSGLYLFHEFPPATFPDITLSDSMTLHFNGERIKIQALAGSHDDNEIVVHFTESKVVHLSSLVNGFNFPSVDEDGDVLAFERLVARAIELLPEDVLIVSGHNDTGTWADLHEYHKMLRETTATVRQGLADGKDLAALQEEAVLDDWQSYAGSYVSVADWTEYLVKGLEGRKEPQKTVFEPLYYTWKEKGAEAAVEHYSELNRKHRDEYRFDEFSLLAIGSKLVSRGLAGDAVTFLRASQAEYPDSTYSYYLNYQLAKAYDELGQQHLAIQHCETALDLNPQFERAADLLRQMKVGSRPES